MNVQAVWSGILTGVRSQVSSSAYRAWFLGSSALELKRAGDRDILIIGTKNSFLKEQLEKKYLPMVVETAKKNGLANCEVIFVVAGPRPREAKAAAAPLFSGVAQTSTSFRKVEILSPNHAFENFVVGASNNLAYMAFSQAAATPGSLYNPLLVYGQTGVGKTHLLQAFGNRVLASVLSAKVLYVSAEKFTNDYIDSLNNHTQQAFRSKYRGADVLLADDGQFFAGKESTQDEFFHTFEELHLSGRQVVIAMDRHPRELTRIKDRLADRLAGGMVVDISKPDLELKIAILKQKCQEKGVDVSGEVLEYIASVSGDGIRELEGSLVRVLALIKLSSGKISLEAIKDSIGTVAAAGKKTVSAGAVIEAVCRHFRVSREDLCGPRRKAALVYPRQVLMFLLRQDLGLALGAIGDLLGGRDHSTVLYGVDKVARLLSANQSKQDEVSRIRAIST
ncbi:chromosomal replication initiator protein DnaA [Candidatus Curtissbacteria bacterium]|nr:chromosomal replication initiator protein DnaA [Candidatus Curtissbacteria bacterium]